MTGRSAWGLALGTAILTPVASSPTWAELPEATPPVEVTELQVNPTDQPAVLLAILLHDADDALQLPAE